jgi:hypothetical protein
VQDSDDIRYMVGALKALGIELEERWEQGEMVVKVSMHPLTSAAPRLHLMMIPPPGTHPQALLGSYVHGLVLHAMHSAQVKAQSTLACRCPHRAVVAASHQPVLSCSSAMQGQLCAH